MGEEPTCVMSAFSYTCSSSSSSGIHTNEHVEGNPVYGMGGGDSVSLGRYMSESLCWEKWSSFSRNRYVEEAEQYSKPGSVAQKKAYFEAHFKRMAALKAAALLEQANAAAAGSKQDNHPHKNMMIMMTTQGEINHHNNTGCKIDFDHSQQNNNTPVGHKGQETDAKFVGNSKIEEGNSIVVGNGKIEAKEGEESSAPTHQNLSEMEHKNNNIIIMTQKEKSKLQDMSSKKQGTSPPMAKKNPPLSSYMLPSVDVSIRTQFVSPAKPIAAAAAGKENYATPATNNKSCVRHNDTDNKKRTPLRRSINRELNKLFSPVLRKIGGNSTKGGLNCSTTLNTPTAKPYVDIDDTTQNPPSEVPQPSSKRRVRALFEASKRENKTYSPTSGLKSPPGPSRNKINSPIIPTLCLRNREKTTSRNENLEEKLNAKATPRRSQQQSKFKGKAEAEFSKLRQSFCFKSTPMSDFHGQTEALSRIHVLKQKSQLLHHPSSTKEKKPTTTCNNRSQNNDILPPRRPLHSGAF